METVMTLVIEESEDISTELLSPILATVKKDNEGILPAAKKLGEKVLENCASKLNAALGQALKSLGTSADDYSEVVSLICRNNNAEKSRVDANAAGEHEVDNEATSPKSEVSSGVKQTAEDDPSTDSISAKKHENADQKTEMEITGVSSNDNPVKSDNGKEIKTARKLKKTTRKRGRKQSTVKKSTKPADNTHTEDEEEAEQYLDNDKDATSDNDKDAKSDNDKDAKSDLPSSPKENQSAEADLPSDGEKEADVAPSSPKEEENESTDISSPSKSAEPKKKERSQEESEGPSDSEGEAHAEDEKKTEDEATDEEKTPVTGKTSRKVGEATDDMETDSVKKSSQKAQASTIDKDVASTKSLRQKKGPVKGKVGRPKDKMNSSKKDAEKEVVSSSKSGKKRPRDEDQPDETPKNKVKGKRTPVKEVGSGGKDYGQDLVGSKVKVWWPDDAEFYKGVVSSFNPVSRKHKIVYNDGDVELLRLKNERWELIQDDSSSSEEQEAEEGTHESSPDVPSKKSIEKTPKGKAVKGGGQLKRGKSGGSVKGKPSSSKPKAKQSAEVDEDSEEGSEKLVESSKTSGSGKKPASTKTPGSKTPGSGMRGGGSKTGGSGGSKTGSRTGKKRRRGA
ncbi:hypothetical protein CRG98_026364 [Punica granatum]|nr:hypothetical protein CRG98_026364 [Punica granatum]